MISHRHRKGEEHVSANDKSPPQASQRIQSMISCAKRRSRTSLCSHPLKETYASDGDEDQLAKPEGFIDDAHSKTVKENDSEFSYIIDSHVQVPHGIFYPGDAVVYTSNGVREMGLFGGAFFSKKTGEEYAVVRAPSTRSGEEFMALSWIDIHNSGQVWGIGRWSVPGTIDSLVTRVRVKRLKESKSKIADGAPEDEDLDSTNLSSPENQSEDSSGSPSAASSSASWTPHDKKRRSSRVQTNNNIDQAKKHKLDQEDAQQMNSMNKALGQELSSVKKDLKAAKNQAITWKKKAEDSNDTLGETKSKLAAAKKSSNAVASQLAAAKKSSSPASSSASSPGTSKALKHNR